MKQYCLKIQSKNEKSLNKFLYFFFKHLKTKFNIIQKSNASKANKKTITFLKSPHVNKTAQTQFETHLFVNKILVVGFYLEKSLIFLKKILVKLFQDISIHLTFLIYEKKSLNLFCPNNTKFSKKSLLKKNHKRYKQKIRLKKPNTEKNSFFYLAKFLTKISVFGEIIILINIKYSNKKINYVSK